MLCSCMCVYAAGADTLASKLGTKAANQVVTDVPPPVVPCLFARARLARVRDVCIHKLTIHGNYYAY